MIAFRGIRGVVRVCAGQGALMVRVVGDRTERWRSSAGRCSGLMVTGPRLSGPKLSGLLVAAGVSLAVLVHVGVGFAATGPVKTPGRLEMRLATAALALARVTDRTWETKLVW